MKDSIFADVISKLNAEVFTQKAGRLYPPVSQLLALEKKLASLPMAESVVKYKKGDIIKFGLGVAMELPKDHEAEIRPRSSTFKNYGLIQTNGVGTVDIS